MLSDAQAFSSFSVDDIEKAKSFYQDVLELSVNETEMGMLELGFMDGSVVMIYPKEDHQPASFTVLNFKVPDVDAKVERLKSRGVQFESYDLDYIRTDEDQIFRDEASGIAIAWFKDPAGNILSLIQSEE